MIPAGPGLVSPLSQGRPLSNQPRRALLKERLAPERVYRSYGRLIKGISECVNEE